MLLKKKKKKGWWGENLVNLVRCMQDFLHMQVMEFHSKLPQQDITPAQAMGCCLILTLRN